MSTEYPTIARVVTKLTNRLLGMMSYLVWFLLQRLPRFNRCAKMSVTKRQDVSQLQIAKPRTRVATWPIGETATKWFFVLISGPFPRVAISVGSPPVVVVVVVVVGCWLLVVGCLCFCCLLFVVVC